MTTLAIGDSGPVQLLIMDILSDSQNTSVS
jgi:hypothetical protein